jgi:tripartite ATP-independent transporter DctP family solute receptor
LSDTHNPRTVTRREFLHTSGVAAASWRSIQAAGQRLIQLHTQPAASTLHRRLVEMWAAIRTETDGRVEAQVLPDNNGLVGRDPAALEMLLSGEIQFFAPMGGTLGHVVPAANVQQVAFAFRSASAAQRAMDGSLGAYLRDEAAAKGMFLLPIGAFDHGMRQIAARNRAITVPNDLVGLRISVPDGRMFDETFIALGAEPITIDVDGLRDGLENRRVDAQENPLAVVELFRLYEVVKYMSMTNHMWSGFNLLANLTMWKKLPDDIKDVIQRNAARCVRLQRQDQAALNDSLRSGLAARGLVFNEVDPAPFRASLSRVYAAWKQDLGSRCWSLLEATSGRLL